MRPILLVGGAPRVAIDAVRHLTVAASGATALRLRALLAAAGRPADLLLAHDAAPAAEAGRYGDRAGLERGLRAWIATHPDGLVLMSAAVNDFELAAVEVVQDGRGAPLPPGAKLPSRADEVVIRLRPAGKVIDQLRGWGLRGPLVGFKYEDGATVLAAAAALQRRVGAALVVANSLDGALQALVDAGGCERCADREALLQRLAARLQAL
jgi:phosphopantothenoylcysteine synthetase/decarboxylase